MKKIKGWIKPEHLAKINKVIPPDLQRVLIQSGLAIAILGLGAYLLYYSFINRTDMGFLSGDVGVVLLLIVLGLLIFYASRFGKDEIRKKRHTEYGSAEWASWDDLHRAGIWTRDFNNPDDGLTYFGEHFVTKNHYHALTVAPSRKGKGTSVILHNLLTKPTSSILVTDPKGELAQMTARWQKSCGQKVHIIDPWNEQKRIGATHGIKLSGFNPFDFVKANKSETKDMCVLLARLIVPPTPGLADDFWERSARDFIKICLWHIVTALPESKHNMETLYKMVRPSDEEWAELLVDMELNKAFDGDISFESRQFRTPMSENPLRSTMTNVWEATSIFSSEALRKSFAHSNVKPGVLADGDCTIYLVIPAKYLETHAKYLAIVSSLLLHTLEMKKGKKVKFILDEFGLMGKMDVVLNGIKHMGGNGVQLWMFIQNLSDLNAIYGDKGMNTLIGNCSLLQFFNPVDNYTCKYLSEMLGETTLETHTSNVNEKGETTKNYSKYGRRLLNPEEVAKHGGSIMIYNHGDTYLKTNMRKRHYYEEGLNGYKGRYDPSRVN